MNTSPKIDLSSIMKSKNTKNKEETKKTETSDGTIVKSSEKSLDIKNLSDTKEINKSPKISLSSIKTNKSSEEKNENIQENKIENHDNMKEELIETLDEYKNDLEENIEEIETKTSTKDTKEEIIQENQEKNNKKVEEETGELFGNYQSDFENKEEKIIKKIEEKKKIIEEKKKNLRERLREPKTRILLVLTLIILTIGGISALFHLYPEYHSLEKYKTSILSNTKKFKQTYIDKPWIDQTIKIEEHSFNIAVQGKGNKANYKYKEIIYKNKSELDNILNNEVILIKEKIAKKEAEIAKFEAERLEAEKKEVVKEIIKNVLLDKFK